MERRFRSKLEEKAAKLLQENGIEFDYEPYKILLIEPFESTVNSYERRGRKFSLSTFKQRAVTYTPDFIGNKFLIETKGYRRPEFNLKWKLLKKLITDNKVDITLFMPHCIKELEQCIEIIKDNELTRKTKDVFRQSKGIQLIINKPVKPKVCKTKADGANRGRRKGTLRSGKRN